MPEDNKLHLIIDEYGSMTIEGKVRFYIPTSQVEKYNIYYDSEDSKKQIEELLRRNKMLKEISDSNSRASTVYLDMLFKALSFLKQHEEATAKELVEKVEAIIAAMDSCAFS